LKSFARFDHGSITDSVPWERLLSCHFTMVSRGGSRSRIPKPLEFLQFCIEKKTFRCRRRDVLGVDSPKTSWALNVCFAGGTIHHCWLYYLSRAIPVIIMKNRLTQEQTVIALDSAAIPILSPPLQNKWKSISRVHSIVRSTQYYLRLTGGIYIVSSLVFFKIPPLALRETLILRFKCLLLSFFLK